MDAFYCTGMGDEKRRLNKEASVISLSRGSCFMQCYNHFTLSGTLK